MSRSYRKPYDSFVGYKSNKKAKRIANRRFRRHSKNGEEVFSVREFSDVWNFPSDGMPVYLPKYLNIDSFFSLNDESIIKSMRK